MFQGALDDHPRRYGLTNELHARPFQPLTAPGRVMHLALKRPQNAVDRDPAADRAHLTDLIDRHGGPHPAPTANHYYNDFGRFRLKWERHTEFVSYTLYDEGHSDDLFATDLADLLPGEWLNAAPGMAIAAIQVEVLRVEDSDAAEALLGDKLMREFNAESLAVARVLDNTALALGDFRIHEEGFTRFALIVHGDVGPRRIGRCAQRLIEIEVYRTLAMLALPIARDAAAKLNEVERDLAELIGQVATDQTTAESEILGALTKRSAELEELAARTAFRFGAGAAYEHIVHQRIESLREERIAGRQMFAEFMLRRFDPAMRTCHAVERRLSDLATRASRIAELLRTRVDVAMEAQNVQLLKSMDDRAALQLRLQETVEGLSTVAISYYAVGLALYIFGGVAEVMDVEKEDLATMLAVPIVLIVWGSIRRMRRRIAARTQAQP